MASLGVLLVSLKSMGAISEIALARKFFWLPRDLLRPEVRLPGGDIFSARNQEPEVVQARRGTGGLASQEHQAVGPAAKPQLFTWHLALDGKPSRSTEKRRMAAMSRTRRAR